MSRTRMNRTARQLGLASIFCLGLVATPPAWGQVLQPGTRASTRHVCTPRSGRPIFLHPCAPFGYFASSWSPWPGALCDPAAPIPEEPPPMPPSDVETLPAPRPEEKPAGPQLMLPQMPGAPSPVLYTPDPQIARPRQAIEFATTQDRRQQPASFRPLRPAPAVPALRPPQ